MVSPSSQGSNFSSSAITLGQIKTTVIQYGRKIHPFIYMTIAFILWCFNVSMPSSKSYSYDSYSSSSTRPSTSTPFLRTPNNNNNHDISSFLDKRPIMYTFFEKINSNKRGTGMDDNADVELINAWRKRWNDAGWDAIVLSLDHAKRHPRYDEFKNKLKDIPMKGTGGSGLNRIYNELCFYRWLAISAVGGGWMSDYDTFPIGYGTGTNMPQHPDLPNDGSFSIFSIAKGSKGAGIPCLMSGDDREWERMAFLVAENGLKHQHVDNWTDMLSLQDLRHSSQYLYIWSDETLDGKDVLVQRDFEKEDCKMFKGRRAVHLSHYAMDGYWRRYVDGDVDERLSPAIYRPKVIENLFKMLEQECGNEVMIVPKNYN